MFLVMCVWRTLLVHGLEDKGLSCIFKQQTSELICAAVHTTSENLDRAYVHRIIIEPVEIIFFFFLWRTLLVHGFILENEGLSCTDRSS